MQGPEQAAAVNVDHRSGLKSCFFQLSLFLFIFCKLRYSIDRLNKRDTVRRNCSDSSFESIKKVENLHDVLCIESLTIATLNYSHSGPNHVRLVSI